MAVKKEVKFLDIGCGSKIGDEPLLESHTIYADVKMTNFNKEFLDINCDGHHLPFRSKVFDVVYVSHVLEHMFYPLKFLREVKRVCKARIVIKVPKLSRCLDHEPEKHIFSWSKSSLHNLLSLVFDDFEIYPTRRKTFVRWPFLRRTFNQLIYWIIAFLRRDKYDVINEFTAICEIR